MSTADEKSRHIRRMFDRIGHRYDLLNRLLSGYGDVRWRRAAVRALDASADDLLLDVGIGTGDLALEAMKGRRKPRLIVGVDAAMGMMRIGRKKPAHPERRTIRFVGGIAEALPLRSGVFDGAMVAFGVRNFTDRAAGLRCIRRVLKPEGRLVVLELSVPRYPVIRQLYRLYAAHAIPWIGGLISGDADAYRYLQVSVEAFPERERFRSLMEDAGFVDTGWRDLTLGVATVYWGDKRS